MRHPYGLALTLVLASLTSAVQAQRAGPPSNFSALTLAPVTLDGSPVGTLLTDYGADEIGSLDVVTRATLGNVRAASAAGVSLADYVAWAGRVADPFADPEDQADSLAVDALGSLADDLTQIESGRSYTVTFHFSSTTSVAPLGEVSRLPVGALRAIPDPAVDQLVVVRFTAPEGENGHATFLFRRPSYVPASFGLRGIQIAANAVPEPATWALMIVGFGMVGTRLRRRATGSRSVTPA